MSKRQHQWSYRSQESESVIGPIQEPEFVKLLKNGTIVGTSLVSSPTRTANKWIAAGEIPALAKFFNPSQSDNVAGVEPIPDAGPYQASVGDSVVVKPPNRRKVAKNDRFRPLQSSPVIWLLRATMLVMAIHGFLFWWFFQYGYSRNSSLATTQAGVFVVQMVLVLLTGILFLRWKHRAYKNLQVACSRQLKTTAGWSVGCYFIPILNLFRPATAMNEIQSRSQASIGYSVVGWWVLYLLSVFVGRVASSAPGDDNRTGHFLTIVAAVFAIVAGFLLLKIIRTVTEKHRRYQQSSEFASSLPIDQWQDSNGVKVPWFDSPRWGTLQLACGLLAAFGWSAVSHFGGNRNSPSSQASVFADEVMIDDELLRLEHEFANESMHSTPESSGARTPRDVPTLISDLIESGEKGLNGYEIRQELSTKGCDDREIVTRLAKQLRETVDAQRFEGILNAMYASSRLISENHDLRSLVAGAMSVAGQRIQTEQLMQMDHNAQSLILESAKLPESVDLLGKLASVDNNWTNRVLNELQRMEDRNAANVAVKIVRDKNIHPRYLRDIDSEVVCQFLWEGKLAAKTGFAEVVVGDSEVSRKAFTKATISAIDADPNRAVESLMALTLHRANYLNRESLPNELVQKVDRALSTNVEKHLGATVKVESVYEAKKRAKKGEGPFAFLDLVKHLGGRETAIAIAKLGRSVPSIFQTYEPIREIMLSVSEPETYDAIAQATAFHGNDRSDAFFKRVGNSIEPAFLQSLKVEQRTKAKNQVEERAQIQRIGNLVTVIRQVGTARSIPALKELAKSKNGLLARIAASAIREIGGQTQVMPQPEPIKVATGARRLQEDIFDLRWSSFEQIDVLKAMNVKRHKLSTEWKKANDILYSPDQPFDRIRMPFVFPEQYDLLIDCKKLSGHGSLAMSLPATTGHRFLVQINAHRPDFRISGLEMIDGVGSARNSTRYDQKLFQRPGRSRILISVRRKVISVAVDGRQIIRYTGPQDVLRCRGRGPWHDKEDLTPVLGTFESRFEFHGILLRSVNGSKSQTAPRPTQTSGKGLRHVGFQLSDTAIQKQIKDARRVHLDTVSEAAFFVGHGTIGRRGKKGYGNDDRVLVGGRPLKHALSTHPPSNGAAHVQYHLESEFKSLSIEPAVTDNGPNAKFQIQFKVLGDGRVLKQSKSVSTSGVVAKWKIDVRGVDTLLLMVQCGKSNQLACAIWGNPVLEK